MAYSLAVSSNGAPFLCTAVGSAVHHDAAGGQHLRLCRRTGPDGAAAQIGLDPRQHLADGKGFGDIVVGPQTQGQGDVRIAVFGRENVTGTVLPPLRMARSTSMPLRPGIIRSSSTRSKCSAANRAQASLPSAAAAVSNPSPSKNSCSMALISLSSSPEAISWIVLLVCLSFIIARCRAKRKSLPPWGKLPLFDLDRKDPPPVGTAQPRGIFFISGSVRQFLAAVGAETEIAA